jgi:Zn-dependent protease
MPTRSAVRLFQFSGITVFLHWSWLLVALYEISAGAGRYSTPVWNVVEYLGLFVIITLHEFGHALACRSVGGRANEILLWPLGGVAFVDPPTRPGATLWSIVAGPLVNVALLPALGSLALLVSYSLSPDVHVLLRSLMMINIGLLAFNLIPVYPLDGGQILGSLLWFLIGRARSIVVSAVVGLVGVAGIALLALRSFSPWLLLIAWFVGQRCLYSLRLAKSLKQLAAAATRREFACPSCRAHPPIGPFWTCGACSATFDVFDPRAGATPASSEDAVTTLSLSSAAVLPSAADLPPGQCPMCHTQSLVIKCVDCNSHTSLADWSVSPVGHESPMDRIPDVTRLRQPRVPSVAGLVGGVCLAILSLMLIGAAVLFFTFGSRVSATERAPFWRGAARAVSAFATIPAAGTVWLLAGYRRKRSEFAAAWQRFHNERDQGVDPSWRLLDRSREVPGGTD